MKKLIMSRGTGKTTMLIRRSADTNLPIVCMTYASARSLKDKASMMGLKIPEPIPISRLEEMRGRDVPAVLVDDADVMCGWLIQQKCGAKVECMAILPEN